MLLSMVSKYRVILIFFVNIIDVRNCHFSVYCSFFKYSKNFSDTEGRAGMAAIVIAGDESLKVGFSYIFLAN